MLHGNRCSPVIFSSNMSTATIHRAPLPWCHLREVLCFSNDNMVEPVLFFLAEVSQALGQHLTPPVHNRQRFVDVTINQNTPPIKTTVVVPLLSILLLYCAVRPPFPFLLFQYAY